MANSHPLDAPSLGEASPVDPPSATVGPMPATKPALDVPAARAAVDAAAATRRPLPVAQVHALANALRPLVEAAEARQATLDAATLGRPATAPTTELEQLVADACAARAAATGRASYGKGDLADEIGLGRASATMLSPAKLRTRGLDPKWEQAIRALIAAPK